MLSPALLDATSFPALHIASEGLREGEGGWIAATRVSIRGMDQRIEVPATVAIEGNRLEVRGQFTVTHEALGLRPFTAAMGALRVRDDILVKYRFAARRS
jgi:hypothetical protein